MLGLCLAAVFAVAAFSASSALAAGPEWGKCVKQAGGKYSDAGCTTKAKGGEYEWKKGKSLPNVKFTGHNVGSGGVLSAKVAGCVNESGEVIPNRREPRSKCESEPGQHVEDFGIIEVECESESNSGEQVGKDGVDNISVKFLGCKVFGSIPCSNGPNEGEVQVNPLKGELGYINKSTKSVGILLTPKTKKAPFATFSCGGLLTTVVGEGNSKEGAFYQPEKKGGNDGIISPIEPVNTMTSNFTQVYTVNHETDENIPSHFEGKPNDLLESYLYLPSEPSISELWGPAGEEITNENTSAEEGEIKA